MSCFLLLNGPNLNLLGTREPEKYGAQTLANIENQLSDYLMDQNVKLNAFQSNAEHELIDTIHSAKNDGVDFILFNPAAFTHTSVALRDALLSVAIPFIEVHLTNPHRREPFRHTSYFSDIAVAVIAGFGAQGYQHAAQYAVRFIHEQKQNKN